MTMPLVFVAHLLGAPWWISALAVPVLLALLIVVWVRMPADPATDADWRANEANTW